MFLRKIPKLQIQLKMNYEKSFYPKIKIHYNHCSFACLLSFLFVAIVLIGEKENKGVNYLRSGKRHNISR